MCGARLQFLRIASVVSCLILAACNGGGGGSSSGSGSGSNSSSLSISLSPSTLSESLEQGFSKSISITATVTGSASGTVYVLIVDNMGVIQANPVITSNPNGTYTATLTTNPNLAVGSYSGNLEIHVCSDSVCSSQLGAANLPYTLNVASSTNLTPLSAWIGIPDWETERGNAAHTAYVPVTLNPTVFSTRWLWTPPNASTTVGVYTTQSDPVSDSANQLIFLSSVRNDGASSLIYALHETDGSQAWELNFTAGTPYQYPSAPAVVNHVLYTTVLDGNNSPWKYFSAYDALSGAPLYQTQVSANCAFACIDGSAVISGNVAFISGSGYARAFNAGNGTLLWTSTAYGTDYASPAVDTQNVYIYVPNSSYQNGPGFTAVDKTTGIIQYGIDGLQKPPSLGQIYYPGSSPVLDGAGGALVNLAGGAGASPLDRFNLSTHTLDWEVNGDFRNNKPGVADGTIYIGNSNPFQFEARRVTDGALLWSWAPPSYDGGYTFYSVVVTQNLVFVSTDRNSYAIDRAAHTSVWSYPLGGGMSISPSGILYIRGTNKLAAINLH